MLTLPRLTAVLRDALGSKRDIRDVSSPLFDVDAATIAREAELKRIRAAREAEAMGGGKSSSGTAFVPIRNTALLAEIIGAHLFNRLPKNEQELYNSFLRIVSLMLGGQMGTEELTESALLVYRLLIQSGAHAAFPDPSEPQEPNYGEDGESYSCPLCPFLHISQDLFVAGNCWKLYRYCIPSFSLTWMTTCMCSISLPHPHPPRSRGVPHPSARPAGRLPYQTQGAAAKAFPKPRG